MRLALFYILMIRKYYQLSLETPLIFRWLPILEILKHAGEKVCLAIKSDMAFEILILASILCTPVLFHWCLSPYLSQFIQCPSPQKVLSYF